MQTKTKTLKINRDALMLLKSSDVLAFDDVCLFLRLKAHFTSSSIPDFVVRVEEALSVKKTTLYAAINRFQNVSKQVLKLEKRRVQNPVRFQIGPDGKKVLVLASYNEFFNLFYPKCPTFFGQGGKTVANFFSVEVTEQHLKSKTYFKTLLFALINEEAERRRVKAYKAKTRFIAKKNSNDLTTMEVPTVCEAGSETIKFKDQDNNCGKVGGKRYATLLSYRTHTTGLKYRNLAAQMDLLTVTPGARKRVAKHVVLNGEDFSHCYYWMGRYWKRDAATVEFRIPRAQGRDGALKIGKPSSEFLEKSARFWATKTDQSVLTTGRTGWSKHDYFGCD